MTSGYRRLNDEKEAKEGKQSTFTDLARHMKEMIIEDKEKDMEGSQVGSGRFKRPIFMVGDMESTFLTMDKSLLYVGDNSTFQKRITWILAIQWISFSFMVNSMAYFFRSPNFSCRVPLTDIFYACSQTTACRLHPSDFQIVASQSPLSIVEEFGLYCGLSSLIYQAEGLFFLGGFISGFLLSYLAERIGRRYPASYLGTWCGMQACDPGGARAQRGLDPALRVGAQLRPLHRQLLLRRLLPLRLRDLGLHLHLGDLGGAVQDDLDQHADDGVGGHADVPGVPGVPAYLALQLLPLRPHLAAHLPLRLLLLPREPALPPQQEVLLAGQADLREDLDHQQAPALQVQAHGGDGGGERGVPEVQGGGRGREAGGPVAGRQAVQLLRPLPLRLGQEGHGRAHVHVDVPLLHLLRAKPRPRVRPAVGLHPHARHLHFLLLRSGGHLWHPHPHLHLQKEVHAAGNDQGVHAGAVRAVRGTVAHRDQQRVQGLLGLHRLLPRGRAHDPPGQSHQVHQQHLLLRTHPLLLGGLPHRGPLAGLRLHAHLRTHGHLHRPLLHRLHARALRAPQLALLPRALRTARLPPLPGDAVARGAHARRHPRGGGGNARQPRKSGNRAQLDAQIPALPVRPQPGRPFQEPPRFLMHLPRQLRIFTKIRQRAKG